MSFNTFMQMTNSWEAARASLGSLSGSSSSAQSNPHQQQQQQQQPQPQQPAKHKQQKYLATPGSAMVPTAPSGSGTYNYFDTPVNANAIVSERTNSLRRLRRAGYANRSFMHHGEYLHHQPAELDDGYGDDFPGGGGGGGGGRLPYFVEPTYRSLEYDRRQRRRHSVHQLASLNVAQLEDARHRFDDYNQSAAIAKGAYYGYYTLDRSKKLSRQLAANQAHHQGMAYGKPLTFGQTGGRGYSGSRTLERVVVEDERGQHRKGPKRGSRSSQGSTDSNNSTHSASSGSLLLTVANLENFAKIHRKPVSGSGGNSKLPGAGSSRTLERYLSSTLELVPHHGTLGRRSRYNSNILLPHEAIEDDEDDAADDGVHPADRAAIDYRKDVQLQHQLQLATSTIVPIDEISIDEGDEEASGNGSEQQLAGSGPGAGGGAAPSLVSPFRSLKGKDPDSVSMASSTHFTMVNGIGGPQRVMKSGICSSGHQITILIVTMSIIFMIGICSAVFLLEMRAREMPK